MQDTAQEELAQNRTAAIVKAYPFGLLVLAILVNAVVFETAPIALALPSPEIVSSLILAAALLVANHTWLMTTTELVRVRNGIHSTPEQWAASGKKKEEAPEEGTRELERRHNIHRNTTENSIHFVFLAIIFALSSPGTAVGLVWLTVFPLARLGYTCSYLAGRDNLRGVFMSLSLLALYGLLSYLLVGILI
jgi:uncharacterized MAPEG superfamily protein